MKLHTNPVRIDSDYTVRINGQNLDLFSAMGQVRSWDSDSPYFFGSFDIDGEARIEIRSAKDLSRAEILPEKSAVQVVSRTRDRLVLTASRPFAVSVEPEGRIRQPLLLFGKEPETDPPSPEDPDVIRFGPGEHTPGRIELKSNQTLYLESGSLVHGVLTASGSNIRVCGRGVLSQEKFPRKYVRHCMDFRFCRDLTIEGIIAKDPCFWNLVLQDCRNVKVNGIALCGGRMQNDDGMDICNSQNVLIQNCFIRAQDDIIAIKGEADLPDLSGDPETCRKIHAESVLDPKQFGPERAVENLEIRDCTFWNDSANVFRIGFECTAPCFRNFRFHDLEILHTVKEVRPHTAFWSNNFILLQASCGIRMEDLQFDRINVHSDGLGMLFLSLRSEECDVWKKPGSIRNCLFRDIAVTGNPENFKGEIYLKQTDPHGKIAGITLQNVTFFGRPLTEENALVFTEGGAQKPEIRGDTGK